MANQLAQLEKCGPVALAHIKQLILTLENKHADYSHQVAGWINVRHSGLPAGDARICRKSRRELPQSIRKLYARKLSTAETLAAQIQDGATIAISGNGGGMVEADHILAAIEARFCKPTPARSATLIHSLGIGDRDSKGTQPFCFTPKCSKRIIAGHFTWSPKMQELVKSNAIEAYCFPGGVIQALLREIGAGRPGLLPTLGWDRLLIHAMVAVSRMNALPTTW